MPFTDEDLKRWKEFWLAESELGEDRIHFLALLARLEAAERLSFARHQRLSCLTTSCDSDCKRSSKRNLEIAEEIWRRAAGK